MAWLQFKHSTGFEAGIKKPVRTDGLKTHFPGSETGAGCYIHQPDCPAAQGDPPQLNQVRLKAKRQFPCLSKRWRQRTL